MKHSTPLFICASLLTLVCIVVSYQARGGVGNSMWDLDAYTRAVHDYADGTDPYRTGISDVFVYHPFVLHAFHAVETAPLPERLGDSPLRTVLLALYVLSTACFLWQLWRFVDEHSASVLVAGWRQALDYGGITLSLFAGIWLSAVYVTPIEYSAFLVALRQQTVASDDLGHSVYGLTRPGLFAITLTVWVLSRYSQTRDGRKADLLDFG